MLARALRVTFSSYRTVNAVMPLAEYRSVRAVAPPDPRRDGRRARPPGDVRPIRPDRLVRAGVALRRWGVTPAGYMVNAIVARRARGGHRRRPHGHLRAARPAHRTRLARALADAGAGPGRPARDPVPQRRSVRRVGRGRRQARRRPAAAQHVVVCGGDRLRCWSASSRRCSSTRRPGRAARACGCRGADRRVSPARVHDSAAGRSFERLATTAAGRPPAPPAEEGRIVILTSGTTGHAEGGATCGAADGLEPLAWFLRVRAGERGLGDDRPRRSSTPGASRTSCSPAARRSTVVLQRRFDPRTRCERSSATARLRGGRAR